MLAATATDSRPKSCHVNSEVNRIEKERKTVSTRFQWVMISAGVDMILFSYPKWIFTLLMAFDWARFNHRWCLNLCSKNSWFHSTNSQQIESTVMDPVPGQVQMSCWRCNVGHFSPKPSELEMAMVSFTLSSFLLRYGGRQIWLKQVWEIGNLGRHSNYNDNDSSHLKFCQLSLFPTKVVPLTDILGMCHFESNMLQKGQGNQYH